MESIIILTYIEYSRVGQVSLRRYFDQHFYDITTVQYSTYCTIKYISSEDNLLLLAYTFYNLQGLRWGLMMRLYRTVQVQITPV